MAVRSTLAVALAIGISGAAAAAPPATMKACFAELERGSNPEIVCQFPLQPSQAERDELEKQTSGYLKQVDCVVSIRIERAQISAAIASADHMFQAPPQPVACKVTMPGKKAGDAIGPDQVIPITGTFAPKVTIREWVATQASPGLANVQGVSRVISLPVVAYLNRAGFIREGMLKTVNAWMVHLRAIKAKAG